MAIVVDAMDLLHAHTVDAFAVVSSDADFTPLVMRILTDGLTVYGYGERKTPEPFVKACSTFIHVDLLTGPDHAPSQIPRQVKQAAGADPRSVERSRLRRDTRLVSVLHSAVDAAGGDEGWANLSAVGSRLPKQPALTPRAYGYSKLSELVEATELFQVRRTGHGVQVRHRP